MADESERLAVGGGPANGAESIALGSASRIKADAYLEEQTRLARLQSETIAAQNAYDISHLRFRRFGDYMKAATEAALALFVTVLVSGFAALLWSAHSAGGLVAEPLKVPPDFTVKGLDGTALSQQLLDKLNRLSADSALYDMREPDSISGSWHDDSKVLIPSTGVSIAELSRLMRDWLGHEKHVSGEVIRSGTAIILTVRIDSNPGVTFKGADADLDRLLGQAASALFERAQPFSYVNGAFGRGYAPDTLEVARHVAESGAADERPYGYLAWAFVLLDRGRNRDALVPSNEAVRLAPDAIYPYYQREVLDVALDHESLELFDNTVSVRRLGSGGSSENIRADAAAEALPQMQSTICALQGDFVCAARDAQIAGSHHFLDYDSVAPSVAAYYYARVHDAATARSILLSTPRMADSELIGSNYLLVGDAIAPAFAIAAAKDDWTGAANSLAATDRAALATDKSGDLRHTFVWPWLAYAWTRTGNISGARSLVALTPLDCTRCLQMRGRVANATGDTSKAAYWFARAVRDAPEIPFAYADWGEMLLHRGDYDGAIAKLEEAHKKGPHFADPLELWGEVLMEKNRSDLALARFEEANKYAPRWGRLHLKWGEALWYVSRREEARAQFQAASELDLSAADRAALMHWKSAHT